MSSRLIPPYAGAIALTIATISSVSWVSSTTGQASTPPNRLNSAALPSITGSDAAGPRLPRPSTAEPSLTTATVLRLMVSRRASAGFSAIAMQTRATPGVYARDSSSRLRSATFEVTSILPPRCSRNVRSETLRTSTPSSAVERLDHLVGVAGVGGVAGEVDDHVGRVGVDHVQRGDDRAGLADAVVSRPIDEASAVTAIRIVIENPALGSRVMATGSLRRARRAASDSRIVYSPGQVPAGMPAAAYRVTVASLRHTRAAVPPALARVRMRVGSA